MIGFIRIVRASRSITSALIALLMWLPLTAAAYCTVDNYTYSWEAPTTNVTWENIGTYPIDDDRQRNVPLGFTFDFGGTNYTTVNVLSNGLLHFVDPSTMYSVYNSTFMPNASYDNYIAPYWDDLNPNTGGTVRYGTFGSAPNRRFVVSWDAVRFYGTTLTASVQVILYENGDFKFQYGGGSTDGAQHATSRSTGATIGFEVSNTDYIQYSFDTASVTNGQAILFRKDCYGTRFYMQNAAPDVTIATHRGSWNNTASVLQRKLSRTKAGAIASKAVAETSGTNNYDVLALKLVGEALSSSQTISGSLNWAAGFQESNNNMNAYWHVHAYVTQGNTDTLRGTLYTDYTQTGTNEWPTTATGGGPTSSLTLTPVNAIAGDRVIIELGYVARNTSNTSYTGTLWYGGTSATDLTIGGDEASFPGWWEFSQDIYPSEVHHYAISYPNGNPGVTCEALAVRVTGHNGTHGTVNPSSTTQITLSTSPAAGGWALKSGSGTFTSPNLYTFSGSESSADFWLTQTTATTAPHIDIDVIDNNGHAEIDGHATEDEKAEFADTAFRYFADTAGTLATLGNTPAGMESSTYYLKAVKRDTTTGTCTAALQSVSTAVNIGYQCNNPTTCTSVTAPSCGSGSSYFCLTPYNGSTAQTAQAISSNGNGVESNTTSVTMHFDASGYAPFTFNYKDAGQITLFASKTLTASSATTPPTTAATVSGATNAFAVKPYGFKLTGLACDAADTLSSATGAFCVAGGKFTGTVTPVIYQSSATNHLGNATPSFGHETTAQTVSFTPDSLIMPTSAAGGALSAFSSTAVTAFTGTPNQATATLYWPNVGTITIKPTLDYLGEGDITAGGASDSAAHTGNVGRFYPHHFSLASGSSVTPACTSGGFTYMDQNALGLGFSLEARNKNDAKTENYLYAATGGYDNGTAGQVGVVTIVAENADAGTDLASRISGLGTVNWGAGAYTVSATTATFARAAAPDGAYDSLAIGVKVAGDPDANVSGANMNAAAAGSCVTAANCDAVMLGTTTKVRYGRLKLSNAYGSDRLALAIPSVLQYYSGSGWLPNTIDSCTVIGAPTLALTATSAAAFSTGAEAMMDAGSGCTAYGTNWTDPLCSGNWNLRLTVPNAPGYADITLPSLPAWLHYPWKSATAAAATARATFGIYGGSNKTIFRRERY